MTSTHEEENLLEGMALTDTTSCPNPDHSQNFTIDAYQGFSLADDEQEFKLSSNQSQDQKPVLRGLEKGQDTHLRMPLTQSLTTTSNKKRYRIGQQPSLKQNYKPGSDKKWETIIELDSKLVEIHCLGLLEEIPDRTAKINQLLLTEEYCKVKLYQNSLEKKLKQIEFTMQQFQKQRKAFLTQISQLKSENQGLVETIQQLSQIIKELELEVEKYIYQQRSKNGKNEQPTQQKLPRTQPDLPVEEDSHFKMLINEGYKEQAKQLKMDDFVGFVNQIRSRTFDLLNKTGDDDCRLYMPILDKLDKNSTVRDWIIEIVANLHQLSTGRSFSVSDYGGSLLREEPSESVLPKFIAVLSQNRDKFAKEIKSSHLKEMQFWFKVHSSVTTFIGIIIQENKRCSLRYSTDSSTQRWRQQLEEEMEELRKSCSIVLQQHKESYWKRMWMMVGDVQNLVTFRLMNSNI